MTYTQLSKPWNIAQPTECHLTKLITIARQLPNDRPLFTVFCTIFVLPSFSITTASLLMSITP